MKILLVAPYGGVPGGIARWTGHILEYYKSIENKTIDLNIVPMGRSSFVNINSPFFYRVTSAIKDYQRIFKNFRNKINRNQYDVMHLTSSASLSLFKDVYMLRFARRHHIKSIVHFRFGRIPELIKQNNWEWRMLCKVVRMADNVIVIDKSSYTTLFECGFKNIVLLPNPVAPIVEKLVIEKQPNLERVDRTILFVGHVVKTKGVFELVEACKDIPNIKLKLVGHVLSEMKQDLIEKSGNADWLDVCGEMKYEEIIEEMLKCNVFVLPTYTEGFPNVILESMACGCPIVTTPVGAIPEMLDIEHGEHCGICVPPTNVEKLKIAIMKMLNDREYALQCGKNAQERVNQCYSMPIVWNHLVDIWNETLIR